MKEFIFSETEGHQAAIFIKTEVLWGMGAEDAGVFSALDRNTSLKNTF